MKFLFAICMIVATSFAWAGTAPESAGVIVVKGKVLEVKDVDKFTYLRLETRDGEIWAAVLKASVKQGDNVTIQNAIVMQNFASKSLKRTFDHILLGTLAGAGSSAGTAAGMGNSAASGAAGSSALGDAFSITPRQQPGAVPMAPVAKADGENAMTIAEIKAKADALKGKPVAVRGKVVKYNAEIMGKNWVHLRDGSATDGSDDLLVTTADKASVGDIVTARGVVNTDQDFGAGYSYKVLVEQATLQK